MRDPVPETEVAFSARRLRTMVLDMAYAGATVHIACAFSIIEILAVLYRSHLRLGDRTAGWAGRDYLVLSKGHGAMAQYACLCELGWLDNSDLVNYGKDGTSLKGLADAHVAGIEVTSGSLGHGLSVGVGLALAAKRKQTGQRCFVIVGDGEMNEGAVWEALLFAAHHELANLMVIVDENGFQAMGLTTEIIRLGSISDKLRAFGFMTREVDGHNEHILDETIRELVLSPGKQPRAIVARTVKGKGVSFMEGNNQWHYSRLSAATYAAAIAELREPREAR